MNGKFSLVETLELSRLNLFFFNTRQEKFNTGRNFCVAHMVEKVPDTPENMRICYENHTSPEFVKLQSTSICVYVQRGKGK